MYVPGPWLKRGVNEFVILDLVGPEKPVLAGLGQPILDQLRPELDFAPTRRPKVTLALDGVGPAHVGEFAPGSESQAIAFAKPARGRFACVESLDAHDGKPFAAIAELDLLDESGSPISHERWTVACVDSEERSAEDGSAENAIDGQTATFWHSQWSSARPDHPHRLVIDLGQSCVVSGFRYVPRQGPDHVAGRIKRYRFYVGDDLIRGG
jgi:beta-galactosidase